MSGCPVSIEKINGAWMLRGHDLVREAALDDVTYSSQVSRFLQVPNGMDGAEHDDFRALTDRYLTHERVHALEPMFTQVAEQVVAGAIDRGGQPTPSASGPIRRPSLERVARLARIARSGATGLGTGELGSNEIGPVRPHRCRRRLVQLHHRSAAQHPAERADRRCHE